MTIEDAEKLKSIPKYIVEKIKRLDKRAYSVPDGHVRFYAYLALWKRKELIKITVAVRHRRKNWYCKQVVIHGIHSEQCFVKDLEYSSYLAMGYTVGWFDFGFQRYPKWYERGWCWADDRYYDPYAPIVNLEVIDKLPEYKYSAYRQYGYLNIFKYLRMYERYPQVEMLVKFGLSQYALSKQLSEKVGKDKKFRTWLIQHSDELSSSYFYICTIFRSYKTGKSLSVIQRLESQKKSFCNKNGSYPELRKFFKGRTDKFLEYVEKQGTNIATYNDYFRACKFLELDMTEDKNVFPHDFKRWHDIRIDEYDTKQAMLDEQKRKELYVKFGSVAEKYLSLQREDTFVVIIAKSPAELIREGEVLHHCVGRMNYDQKFVREESLIFFVRNKNNPDIPFVTVEYSLSQKKVLQCYGDNDTKPDESVLEFVNKKWLPYANRTVRKLLKQAA